MDPSGIGAKLKEARLGKGLGLDEIARQTRIAQRYLEAIERGDFETLPGIVFTRNFVRQYALALGLDPAPLIAPLPVPDESTRQLPDASRQPKRKRQRWKSGEHSMVASVGWLALAVGVFLGLWVRHNHMEWMGWLPPHSAQASSATGSSAIQVPASPPAAVAATDSGVTDKPVELPAAVPQTEASAPPVEAIAPQTSIPAATHPVQVIVTAVQSAWVQVVADGKTAYTGTLHPNETREISADEKVRIVAGNAGGLEVSLNGKKLDPLGPIGQVRVVTLTAEGPLLSAPAAAPRPSDPL